MMSGYALTGTFPRTHAGGTPGLSYFQLRSKTGRSMKSRPETRTPNEGVEFRWLGYLDQLRTAVGAGDQLAHAGRTLWALIRETSPKAPVPSARLTEEGHLRMSWNQPGRYLEIVLTGGDRYDWSFADPDRDTYADGEEVSLSSVIPSGLWTMLAYFA